MHNRSILLLIATLAGLLINDAMAVDLSTPETALASFYEAYARQDIDDIVASRDFEFEARESLSSAKDRPDVLDEELVRQTAREMEAAFRTQIQKNGFPKVDHSKCKVIKTWSL